MSNTTVRSYREIPPVIEAVRWNKAGDGFNAVAFSPKVPPPEKFCGLCGHAYSDHGQRNHKTAECKFDVICPGNWLVKSADGFWRLMSNANFESRYQLVEPGPAKVADA